MSDIDQPTDEVSPRRNFFGVALSALGVLGFAASGARAQTPPADGPDWPGKFNTRHRQMFDIYDINDGFPLGFVNNFLAPNMSATAVMIFRHKGLPYALNSTIWQKYKVGETFNIMDPETKAVAVKNPWYQPKPGVLANPDVALDRLIAKGAVIGACGVALRGQSRRLAGNAGVSPDDAFKEFAANLLPGVTIVPSGTWAVNRAQEAGCTYCAGGSL